MFVRYRYPSTYTVLQSVRTPAGPRQKCVAHWSGTPSLAEAIERLRKHAADHEQTRGRYRRAAGGETVIMPMFGNKLTKKNAIPRLPEIERDHERLKRRLAGLEAAHAVIGDWVDPVDRPDDAAHLAKRRYEPRRRRTKEQIERQRKREEHERWLEGMMKMAM